MRRTTSHRNFFSTSNGGSSTAAASGSNKSTSCESPPSPPPPPGDQSIQKERKTGIAKVIAENPIVIVAMLGCFMCVIVKDLVQTLGVNPEIIEVEETKKIATLVQLSKIEEENEGPGELPAVYVGGKLLGGAEEVIEAHIKGEFVQMLRAAGALCP